jgi:nonsense-mediated mRNA decay protein 3
MGIFCPKCGAEGRKLAHGLCESCFWEEQLEGFLKEFKVPMCNSCFSYLHGKRWVRKREGMPEEKVIEGAKDEFMRLADLPEGVEFGEIEGEVTERAKSGLPKMILLTTTLTERDSGISTKVRSLGRVDYRLCQDCYHVASGKWEAVVQIRAEGRRFEDEDMMAVERVFENFYRRTEGRGKPEVSEVKEHEGGIDVKFITLNAARMFVRELTETTGASVVESAKIMGIDKRTGGSHYRTTIATKMPSLRVGELIELDGKVFQIAGHHRGRLVVKDLSEGEGKRSLAHNQLAMAKKIKSNEYRQVRLEAKTARFGTFLDLVDKKFFDLPIDFVPKDMTEGDVGVLICVNGNEAVYKLGGGPVGIRTRDQRVSSIS